MCAYQKNYEQYVKNGTEIEDTEIKNRFEIRMKNERAYYAVVDLLTLSLIHISQLSAEWLSGTYTDLAGFQGRTFAAGRTGSKGLSLIHIYISEKR